MSLYSAVNTFRKNLEDGNLFLEYNGVLLLVLTLTYMIKSSILYIYFYIFF